MATRLHLGEVHSTVALLADMEVTKLPETGNTKGGQCSR